MPIRKVRRSTHLHGTNLSLSGGFVLPIGSSLVFLASLSSLVKVWFDCSLQPHFPSLSLPWPRHATLLLVPWRWWLILLALPHHLLLPRMSFLPLVPLQTPVILLEISTMPSSVRTPLPSPSKDRKPLPSLMPLCTLHSDSCEWNGKVEKICPPETCEFTLFRKRVFADEIELRILRWYHPGLGWTLNPMTAVLIRKKAEGDLTRTQRGMTYVNMETDWMCLQAKEFQGLAEANRS